MEWTAPIFEPLRSLYFQLQSLLPRLLGALLIIVVGWTVASLLRRLMVRLFQLIGLERMAEKAKICDVLRRGAIRLTFVELLGQLGYWLVIVATMIVVLQYVGVTAADEWLQRFGAFIPRVIVSIVVFLFGMLLASFLGATVRAASLNAGFPQGHLVGQVVYTLVLVVTIIVALEQLQVVTRTIQVALYILMATFGLAFALALGLGAQGLMKRFLEDIVWEKWKSSHRR